MQGRISKGKILSICWSTPRCGRYTLVAKTGTHCTGDLLGLGVSIVGTENLTQLGFDPEANQPIAARYTDYATPTSRGNF